MMKREGMHAERQINGGEDEEEDEEMPLVSERCVKKKYEENKK